MKNKHFIEVQIYVQLSPKTGIPLAKEFDSELGQDQVGKSIICQFHIFYHYW